MNILFFMVLGIIILLILGTWCIAIQCQWKVREQFRYLAKKTPGYLYLLIPLGMLLQEKIPKWRKPPEPLCRELRNLYPSSQPEKVYRAYMLQQILRISGVLLFLVLTILWFLPGFSGDQRVGGSLPRPSFQEGKKDTILVAQSEEERIEFYLKVEPMDPDEREIQQILSEAKRNLQSEFQHLGEIHRSMQLPRKLGEVEVRYEDADGMIDSSGFLHLSVQDREYRMILVKAILSYRKETTNADLELVINTVSEESLQDMLLKTIEENQTQEEILLPDHVTVHGKEQSVIYYKPGNLRQWPIWGMLAMLLPFLVWRLGKEQLQEESAKRKEKIHQCFPFAAEKLAVYLGSGMGLSEAWGRTALEGMDSDPLIREMRLTYQQMKNGIGIQEAILQFGNRVESPDLKKLAGILSRNIRRGDDYLLENLKNLNHEAWEQHRREVRIQIEKSQTKLLFPMLLMMGVVLILILTPALISML